VRLAYVAIARLPTESAHGVQIARMCEAFSELAVDVHLIHPFRVQPSPALQHVSVSEYYGLAYPFPVTTVPGTDIVRSTQWVPEPVRSSTISAYWYRWSKRVIRDLLDQRFEVCFTREPVVAYRAQQYGLPVVLELHRQPKRFNRRLLERTLGAPALRGVVTVTEALRRRIERMRPEGRAVPVITCPDAVDLRSYEGLPDRAACRRRLRLPGDRRIVGYIGRFRSVGAEKGIPELIRALPHLGAQREGCLLLCVGGPLGAVEHYQRMAADAGVGPGEITFVDRVPHAEVPYWIRACDVVTIPLARTEHSAFFTSPMKMFEYMAAEVPIVASDLESLREVLRHDENALIADTGSPVAFAHQISRVLADPSLAERLARAARHTVERYTWRERAATIRDRLLNPQCGGRSRRGTP
jgi:glycosyltransferase involved in cell wall biosynthesis